MTALVTAFGISGIFAAAFPFISSMEPSAKAMNDSVFAVEIPVLKREVVYSVNVDRHALFLLKPSKEQLAALHALDRHVWSRPIDTFDENLGAYVYWGISSKWDFPLDHKPPQVSRLLEWDKGAKWLGGYWDWWCEVSYDYSGRAIKTYRYAFNGYTLEEKNLRRPSVFERSGTKFVVSKYGR